MRNKTIIGTFLLLITVAWLLSLPAEARFIPLVDAQGAATGWWHLRRQLLLLTGLWSIGLLSLTMLLALRLPLAERLCGGLDKVYQLHKWTAISAAVAAIMHWLAKHSSGLLKAHWGKLGRPGHDAVLPWLTDTRAFAKALGEWSLYLLLAVVAIALLSRLLAYRPWRQLHRMVPLLYLAMAAHTICLMPLAFWQQAVGMLMIPLLLGGTAAALWTLAGRIGRARQYHGTVHAFRRLGDDPAHDPLEIICLLPSAWPGHRPGQFVLTTFDMAEGAHPFSIASAPYRLDDRPALRLIVKPLGDYTRQLAHTLRVGQEVVIEGPYGYFDGRGNPRQAQYWIAAGVGVVPFLSLLEDRQDGQQTPPGSHPQKLHYCCRGAARDPLLPRLQTLCAGASPPIALQVHDSQQGQRFHPHEMDADGLPAEVWYCGPQSLGKALQDYLHKWPGSRLQQEFFNMR